MHDAKALQRLQQGDEEALAWIIDRYTPYVHTVVCHVMGQYMSQADMEEVDADVFVALWHNAASIRPAALKGWLGTVARNAAKNKLRSAGQEIPLEEDAILLTEDTPEDEALRAERHNAVRRAVLSMPWPDREIFLRHYYYYQPLADVAREMDMNLSTVKTRLRRGREKLRAVLTQEGYIEGGTYEASENF